MLILSAGDLIGRDADLGVADVTPERIRRYAIAIGDEVLAAGPCEIAPLGFALALRGGPIPEVETAPGTLSVHGGHVITAHRALTAPAAYSIRARITDVFEKSGRSGALTVVARRAELRAADGSTVVTIDDQQIVRRPRTSTTGAAESVPRTSPAPDDYDPPPSNRGDAAAADPEVGDLLGPEGRAAPAPAAVAGYAAALEDRGPRFFTDRTFAQSLGYDDVIVPGPLQSALLEALLRRRLPDWQLRSLAVTFRVSVIANEPIALSAVIVERHPRPDGVGLVCDLSLENRYGERAATGSAQLFRPGPPP
jgi:hydroxyacyl-ACP dehydratase HTD2-like protein with hotdog domain